MSTYAEYIDQRDKEALRSILKTAWGRRFIWKQLARAGVFMQSAVPGNADATFYNEGRRSIGLTLLTEVMEIDPEAYLKMTKMAKEDESVREKMEQAEKAAQVGDSVFGADDDGNTG